MKPEERSYNPHLSADKHYLAGVADTIAAREPIEEVRFHLLNDALEALGITEDPYKLVNLDDLNPAGLQKLVAQSFSALKGHRGVDEAKALWDYLQEEDEPTKSDLIFVFGGPGTNRLDKALELYRVGLAPKILFTGHSASYMDNGQEVGEAKFFADEAQKRGVPAEAIMVEPKAKNTPENAAFSVAMMKQQNYKPQTIIAITLPYHMRRSYLTLRAACDWSPKVLRVVAASSKFTRDDFYKDEKGWSYVFFEFIKLYGARLMKHF